MASIDPRQPLVAFRLPVAVPRGEVRHFELLPARAAYPWRRGCRWAFEGADPRRVRLEGPYEGVLAIRARGPCGPVGHLVELPPPVAETFEDEDWLRALLAAERAP